MNQETIDKSLKDNYIVLQNLRSELEQLKIIREKIESLKNSNDQLPTIFEEKFSKIIKLTNEYTSVLNETTTVFVEGNNKLLATNINQIELKTVVLGVEIDRLLAVDFKVLFKELETEFLKTSKTEIGKELNKIDEKVADFQTKIDGFGEEITRLSKIDLEGHFEKHQNKLSEIFIAVNGINSLMATITQNINVIIQNLGETNKLIADNHHKLFKSTNLIIEKQESNQQENNFKFEEQSKKLEILQTQNDTLKKEVDFSKKLSFVAIGLLVVVLIIILAK
jgi:hypothetical protein